MAGTLIPKFEPLRFQQECAPPGTPLFDPMLVSERALLVAGGPLAVGVFRVHERPRAWYTVKAQVLIAGFCVSAGSLYVQDGPVLSGWDLTMGECFGAQSFRRHVLASRRGRGRRRDECPAAVVLPDCRRRRRPSCRADAGAHRACLGRAAGIGRGTVARAG
ncbi:MAG TPA: hypothetical protein VGN04_06945 [Herbaspirillum sp.]